jgi:hypothetical protein
MQYRTLCSVAAVLERAVIGLAIAALVYRATLYNLIEKAPGAAWGTGDVIDFALGLLLFLCGGLCAASGVALAAMSDHADKGVAYRPVLIGMTTFVVYYLVHPYIPPLL